MKLFKLDIDEIWKLSCRDIRDGFMRNRKKYLGIILLVFIFFFNFKIQVNAYYGGNIYSASFMDLAVYVCKGKVYFNPDARTKYEIPFMWLAIQMYIAYLIGDYASEDRTKLGQQYILRSTHMGNWLAGKWVYCVFNCLLFYAIMFAVCFAVTVPISHSIFAIHEELNLVTSCLHIARHTTFDLYRGVFIMPVLTSILFSFAQVIMQLMVKPIFSYLGILFYSLLSDYVLSYFLIGNYSMMVRNIQENAVDGIVNPAKYIDPSRGILIEVICMSVLFVAGQCLLRKYDYLERE